MDVEAEATLWTVAGAAISGSLVYFLLDWLIAPDSTIAQQLVIIISLLAAVGGAYISLMTFMILVLVTLLSREKEIIG